MELRIRVKAKGRKRRQASDVVAPTPEQMVAARFELEDIVDKQANGRSITIGKAYRRVPMIDTLRDQGVLSASEHKALKHYRHHADVADKSLIRDSLCVQRYGGTGDRPTHEVLYAQRVRDDCERAAGSLADILRAVVIDDMSLSAWAIQQAGGVDTRRIKGGRVLCSIEPKKRALAIARVEIKIAAGRVQAEIDA